MNRIERRGRKQKKAARTAQRQRVFSKSLVLLILRNPIQRSLASSNQGFLKRNSGPEVFGDSGGRSGSLAGGKSPQSQRSLPPNSGRHYFNRTATGENAGKFPAIFFSIFEEGRSRPALYPAQ